jgi:hypothetical protein
MVNYSGSKPKYYRLRKKTGAVDTRINTSKNVVKLQKFNKQVFQCSRLFQRHITSQTAKDTTVYTFISTVASASINAVSIYQANSGTL